MPPSAATLAAAAAATLLAAGAAPDAPLAYEEVFTQAELEACGWRIRTPALVQTKKAMHVLGRCCGANLCSTNPHMCVGTHCKNGSSSAIGAELGDDNSDSTTVMKTSWDGGRSWTNFQTITPKGAAGYSCSHGLYDRQRDRVVVQYTRFPTNTTRPASSLSTYQVITEDEGRSWTAPRDISDQIRGCSVSEENMMYLSAGEKIQTKSGRMLWPAHSFGGHACVWYSDDGGDSYNVSEILVGNEVSVAELGDGRILMNGRGSEYPFGPGHRVRYWSYDGEAPLSSCRACKSISRKRPLKRSCFAQTARAGARARSRRWLGTTAPPASAR